MMSGKYRWVVAGLVLYMLGIIAYVTYDYTSAKREAYQVLDQRLLTGASAISAIIGNSYHAQLTQGGISEAEYLDLVQRLSSLVDASGLNYVYSMVRDGDAVLFTSSSATEEELADGSFSKPMDPYDEASDDLKQAFHGNTPVFEVYTDQWGTFRSVFVPMLTGDGTRYVVGADISIEKVRSTIWNKLLKSLVSGAVFLLLLVPLGVALLKLARSDRRLLKEEIERNTREIGDLNKSLEERILSAEEEAERARQATEEASLARGQAERARREGMLHAAGQIEGVVQRLSSASEEISSQIEQSSKGSEVQRERASETAASMV
ncbi:hypothetical protein V6C53_18900, partial [Desulfocurvibacter africanus]